MSKNIEENLKKYSSERKWYELGDLIISNISNHYELCFSYALQYLERFHPITLSQIATTIYQNATADPEIIRNVLDHFKERGANDQLRVSVILDHCMFLIESKNDLTDMESKIYEISKHDLNKSNLEKLNFLAYSYYSHENKVDLAYEYLMRVSPSNFDIEEACKLAILSPQIYSFSPLISHDKFDSIKSDDLKMLLYALNKGEFPSKSIPSIPGIPSDIINDKFELIRLLNVVRGRKGDFVPFSEFKNENGLILLLLKALGLNLIKGWIDSKNKVLFVESVIPKDLDSEEIEVVKERFILMRNRVEEVIKMLVSK